MEEQTLMQRTFVVNPKDPQSYEHRKVLRDDFATCKSFELLDGPGFYQFACWALQGTLECMKDPDWLARVRGEPREEDPEDE